MLNLPQPKNLQLEAVSNLGNTSKAVWEEHVREERPPVVSLTEVASVLAVTEIMHMYKDRYVRHSFWVIWQKSKFGST